MADNGTLFDHPPHPQLPYMRRDFKGWVSRTTSRTICPVKYYIIDFGLSQFYGSEDVRLKTPPWGGDRTVPEHLLPNAPPCDPFPVDVYCIGNIIREGYLDGSEYLRLRPKKGFEFMRELVTDMVNNDPKKRPTMDEVVSRYDKIVVGLSEWKLRSPVITAGDFYTIFHSIFHWTKQIFRIMRRIRAIPKA
ncbi:hypothetical protein H0H87_005017 [Tephrocybe sp. NHM501043]|nr:hypothetical protein H0H87_005017 [Tephrocybe sp. NHM501043]